MSPLPSEIFEVIKMKKHYVDFHGVDENNTYFLELFQPDALNRRGVKCSVMFLTCRMKKNHMFLYHYNKEVALDREQMIYLSIF